jgi:hypothetical protein
VINKNKPRERRGKGPLGGGGGNIAKRKKNIILLIFISVIMNLNTIYSPVSAMHIAP